MIEFAVVGPVLTLLGLALLQYGLLFFAKNGFNHAAFMAARAGAVGNASLSSVQQAYVRALVPLYGGGRNSAELAEAYARAQADVNGHLRIELLNPTPESFDDWNDPALQRTLGQGRRVIPNGNQAFKNPDDIRNRSGQNIHDANLIKLRFTQGYKASGVTARWAFWLRDMGGANALTQVLYDPRGGFLGSSTNPLGASSKAYAQWTSSQPNTQGTVQAFVSYYVKDMLSPDSFTQEIDDAAALQLLEDLQTFGDVTRKYIAAACSGGNAAGGADYQLVLPSVQLRGVTLSPGGIAGLNDEPGGQRIDQGADSLTCQQAMTPERAFQRLKRAVQIKESGGMDCSKTGCAALAQNPAGTPASYGSTQFVVSTFVDRMLTFSDVRKLSTNPNLVYQTLFNSQANLSEEEKKALGLIDAQGQDTGLRQRLEQARLHFLHILGGYLGQKKIVGWNTLLTADTSIDPADDRQVQQFAKETGFSHTPGSTSSEAYGMYVRMVKWAKMAKLMNGFRKDGGGKADAAYVLLHQEAESQQKRGDSPTVEQRFDALLADLGMTRDGFRLYLKDPANWNEGWQGFASAAVFTDKTLKAVLLDTPSALFKSRQKFDLISDREIRWKYAAYRIKYPNETEEDIVARIGYFHNAGSDAKALSVARNFEYAKGLVGIWSNTTKMPCDVMNVPRLALDPIKPKS